MTKLKRGTVRDDGMVFFGYKPRKSGEPHEYWVTSERFEQYRSHPPSQIGRSALMNDQQKAKRRDAVARWKAANPDKVKLYSKRRKKGIVRKYGTSLSRVAHSYRTRLVKVLTNKNRSSYSYLGCSILELREHLQSQFSSGMTWENYGFYGWHVDHRIPLASATSLEELLPLLHFSNLQPLWAKHNLSKGAKLDFSHG